MRDTGIAHRFEITAGTMLAIWTGAREEVAAPHAGGDFEDESFELAAATMTQPFGSSP